MVFPSVRYADPPRRVESRQGSVKNYSSSSSGRSAQLHTPYADFDYTPGHASRDRPNDLGVGRDRNGSLRLERVHQDPNSSYGSSNSWSRSSGSRGSSAATPAPAAPLPTPRKTDPRYAATTGWRRRDGGGPSRHPDREGYEPPPRETTWASGRRDPSPRRITMGPASSSRTYRDDRYY
ncbi:hypothetical protein MMC09_004900 [Bachmanniomyces sp. S44760]|nr:hypothetical protein [Bachmanniomyces sp. S44760]